MLPQSHDSVSDGDVSEITIDNPDISDNKIKIPEVDDLQPEISTKPTIKAAIDDYNQDGILLIKKSY